LHRVGRLGRQVGHDPRRRGGPVGPRVVEFASGDERGVLSVEAIPCGLERKSRTPGRVVKVSERVDNFEFHLAPSVDVRGDACRVTVGDAFQRDDEPLEAALETLAACKRRYLLLRSALSTRSADLPLALGTSPERLAAAVGGPVILHQYLLADPVNSTVTELALWSQSPPRTPWPAVIDATVFDALGAPLCVAYIGSCP
jgi:hypothetical protein